MEEKKERERQGKRIQKEKEREREVTELCVIRERAIDTGGK